MSNLTCFCESSLCDHNARRELAELERIDAERPALCPDWCRGGCERERRAARITELRQLLNALDNGPSKDPNPKMGFPYGTVAKCDRSADLRFSVAYIGQMCTQCVSNMCATGGDEYITLVEELTFLCDKE